MKLTPKTVMSLVVYRSLIVAAVLILSTLFLYLKFDRSVKLPLLSKNRPQGQAWEPLRFGKDGTFQISVFEDLHYGEAENLEWGPWQDVNSERVMNSILDVEHPQLIVLNGDLITGDDALRENSSHYLDEIVRPILQHGLPWASAYGNHDSAFNLSSQALFAREKRYRNSLTESMVDGDSAGVTNYFLPVYGSQKQTTDHPSLLLWFFDSQAGNYYQKHDEDGNEIPRPSWVDQNVVTWFEKTNARLTDHGRIKIPSLGFVHIPINAMTAFQDGGIDSHKEPGINDDYPVSQQGLVKDEDGIDQYTGKDIPFMSALLETPGMMAIFSGHDHGNDWCFKWNSKLSDMNLTGNGLNVCFGRHTGYGGYGEWTRGSRQILLDERTIGETCETWIRLEDGKVSGKVTLNSTYGKDEYPGVEN